MRPSLFIAHGSPMVAIEQSEYAHFLEQLGTTLGRPKAIILFSAHWENPVQMVSDVEQYSTIYDFRGFPEELYRVTYPAMGHHELSRDIQQRLTAQGIPHQVETQRGFDHGAWTILHKLFPKVDIPVIAMSVNADLSPAEQYRIGRALAPLRAEDILIIGSGVTVHNFQLFNHRENPEVHAAVESFENWLEEKLHHWDTDALFQYETQAPHAKLAVPANGAEHFVPLFYAMGASDNHQTAQTLHRSMFMNIMTNSVYQFG